MTLAMSGSVLIKFSILRTDDITDVWSNPPNLLPISGREWVVTSRQRYIAIWRGRTTPLSRLRCRSLVLSMLNFLQTAS